MKHLFGAASAAALSLALAMPATAQEDGLKIGMTFQEMNNPYFVSMQEALMAAAEDLGAEVVVTDAGHDVAKQISDVEDMLTQGIDILLLNPTDSAGIESAVHMAKAQDVIVVAVDANANGPVDTFVGSKNRDAGYQSCKYLAEAIDGEGEVAILDGIPVVPILERVEGCKAALDEFDGVTLVDTQNGRQDRSVALGVVENGIRRIRVLWPISSLAEDPARLAVQVTEGDYGKSEVVAILSREPLFDIRRPRDESVASVAEALAETLEGREGVVLGIASRIIDARP